MEYLSSSKINLIRDLRKREERYAKGLYWAEGERTIASLIKAKALVEFIVLSEEFKCCLDKKLFYCRQKDINKIKATDTFPGIGALIKMPEMQELKTNTIIALDRINDPGNLGTILRTALWFGVDEFILDSENADPFNEKAVRSSMGSVASIKFNFSKNLTLTLEKYKSKGYSLIAADLKGNIFKQEKPEKMILVFGNEANGIRDEILKLCDELIKIPGSGRFESLNVAVAAGIIINQMVN